MKPKGEIEHADKIPDEVHKDYRKINETKLD
jgi:hypothetical protein